MLKLSVNPEKYVKTQARSLQIVKCLINDDWQEGSLAYIIVVRQHKTLNLTVGIFVIDVYCLGLKETAFEFNIPPDELKNLTPDLNWEECDYALVHNIIYGGIDYAEDFGFRPHKDFQVTKFLLENDDDNIEFIDMEFGREGKPCFIISPDDDPVDVKNTISTLERNAGQGNFEILFSEDEGWDDDDDPDEYLDEHFNLDEMTKVTTELNLSYNEVFRTQAEVKSLMDYPLAQDYEITWDPIENKYNLFDNQEQKREYLKFHKLITHDDAAELIIP